MSPARGLLVVMLLATAACGGDPPDKEMQQAQGAIDAAIAAGAETYAREEIAAAQSALTRADEAVGARDYRLALNHALDSGARARNAARLAADGKAAARGDADGAVSDAAAAVAALRTRLKAPDTSRFPARALTAARNAAADGERRVQEARTAVERGDYAAGTAAAAAASTAVTAATRVLDAAASAPARRRR
jgi:hypothetical protein